MMATVMAGITMGLTGQGPLGGGGGIMNIFYALAALGLLETILQEYRLFPISPAFNLPSPRKFALQDESRNGAETAIKAPSPTFVRSRVNSGRRPRSRRCPQIGRGKLVKAA